MKDKYEFTYQMTYTDLASLSFAIIKQSFFQTTYVIYYILSCVFVFLLTAYFVDLWNEDVSLLWFLLPIIVTIGIFRVINSRLKREQLSIPCLKFETHLVVTNINIQDRCDGYLSIIPYKHMKFFETSQAFGFFYNMIMVSPVPKRLFANQTEIDEFRLFVQQNMLTSNEGVSS